MRTRSFLCVVLLVALGTGLAAAQQGPDPPVAGHASERGWNPGSLASSLVFGVKVGVLGMLVVFAGLIVVYAFLVGLRRALARRSRHLREAGDIRPAPPCEMSAEVAHAIALALYMDLRAFDEDTAEEITIRKMTRPFSPWMDSGKTRVLLNNQLMFRK